MLHGIPNLIKKTKNKKRKKKKKKKKKEKKRKKRKKEKKVMPPHLNINNVPGPKSGIIKLQRVFLLYFFIIKMINIII